MKRHYLLLIAAGLLAYANSFSAPFVFDSKYHIVEQGKFERLPLSWNEALHHGRWLPDLTFSLNYRCGGTEVWGYHAVNLTLHLAAALALYDIVRRTLRERRDSDPAQSATAELLALAAALVWMLHPLQTESVTYVIQRYELMMGLFSLLSLDCFIRGARPHLTAQNPKLQSFAWLMLSLICMGLALRSKEAAIVLPLLILWYDRALLSSSWRELAWKHGIYYGAILAAALPLSLRLLQDVTRGILSNFAPASTAAPQPLSTAIVVPGMNPVDYALTQPAVILHYLRLTIWPRGLCLDYAWPIAMFEEDFKFPLMVVASLAAVGLLAVWRHPGWGFLCGWFFVNLAPRSSFMPHQDLACEHRMYLPLAAIAVGFAIGSFKSFRWISRRLGQSGASAARVAEQATLWAAMIVAIALGTLTFLRNQDYRSERTLWATVVAISPKNPRGHLGLGYAWAAEHQPQRAAEELEIALALQPLNFRAQYHCGLAYAELGEYPTAIEHFQQAVILRPEFAAAQAELRQAVQKLRAQRSP